VLNGGQVQAMSSTIDKTEGPLREFPSQVQRDRRLTTAASPSPIVRATGDPEMDAQVSPHTCPISVAPLSGAFRNSTENGPRHTPVQGCQRWERSATFCGYRGRFIGRVLAIKVNRAKFPQPPRGFEPGPTHYEIVWPRKQARAPSRIMPRETSGSTRPR